jgi:diamine N-acetyltransferase
LKAAVSTEGLVKFIKPISQNLPYNRGVKQMEKYIIKLDGIHLKKTTIEDLDFVIQTENHRENKDFVMSWTLKQHRDSLLDEDKLHLIIETSDKKRIGYAILAGLKNTNSSIELVRIVIADKGKGYGRTSIKAIQKYTFENLNAHRLWLDVKDYNERARYLYQSTGFVEEGRLRECIKNGDRYESLIIMSILQKEYRKEVRMG